MSQLISSGPSTRNHPPPYPDAYHQKNGRRGQSRKGILQHCLTRYKLAVPPGSLHISRREATKKGREDIPSLPFFFTLTTPARTRL